MNLSNEIQQKLNELYAGLNKKSLTDTREGLTEKYKKDSGSGKSLIDSKTDSLVYAISRMPATYSVICTLLFDLKNQGLLENIESVIDIGSGTGAGYFAVKDVFENIDIKLFERDKNMIDVFAELEPNKIVTKLDVTNGSILEKADLVVTSYVLSEMNEANRLETVKKMLDISNDYVLLIDTGTPRTYENFMKIKYMVQDIGYNVIAPCGTDKCTLKNDYCQFYARVERSSLLRVSKNGTNSYEDEKYFYLLISKKNHAKTDLKRVIYRPQIKTNFVELKTCSNAGVNTINVTKKDKELFKKSKKIKINELL